MSLPVEDVNDLRSEISESDLSETLTLETLSDLNTQTEHAVITGDSVDNVLDDVVHACGRVYVAVPRTASIRGIKPSWIWTHGRELRYLGSSTPAKSWQCTYCSKVILVERSTSHAIEHLHKRHETFKEGTPTLEEDDNAPPSIMHRLANVGYKALVSSVQRDRFRYLLIRWIVCMHICLWVVEDSTFRELLLYISPALTPFFVRSANTVRRWIMQEFEKQKVKIREELQQSKSLIHISFDLWTSPNALGLVGVIAHFLDKDLVNRSIMIGMRRVSGSHAGENIAAAITPILLELDIVNKLGCFTTDNATNNDTCIQALCRDLLPGVNWRERRVRCLGHIINLAADAYLDGTNNAAFDDTIETDDVMSTRAQLLFWRKKGAKGKLHNIIVYIRATPQRRERFSRCCSLINEVESDFPCLMVILDNSTRWNSTYDSITRAIKLYTAINIFCFENKADLSGDTLSSDDWDELRTQADVLKPFKDLTVELQSRASAGNYGSVWETLPAIKMLLEHIEQRKFGLNIELINSPLAVSINACWNILRKYYELTDANMNVYAMATLLNPATRLQYFKDHWNEGELTDYVDVVEKSCHAHWKDTYEHRKIASTLPRKRTALEAFLHRLPTDGSEDEFLKFTRAAPTTTGPDQPALNPFHWHEAHRNQNPTLCQLALDTLSIPAMATECERAFSSAKKLISQERNRLDETVIEATEVLKAWWDAGMLTQLW